MFLGAGMWAVACGPRAPKVVVFESSLGPVRFDHAHHVRDLNLECPTCHHPRPGEAKPQPRAERPEACRKCHQERSETAEGDPPSFYDVKMKLCRGCHLDRKTVDRDSRAPTDCEQCHDIRKALRGGSR